MSSREVFTLERIPDALSRAPVAHLDKGPVITELLSRGSQVRALPGAPIPNEFADFLSQ